MTSNMEVTYHKEGQALYPDLAIGNEGKKPRTVGKYGLLRKRRSGTA